MKNEIFLVELSGDNPLLAKYELRALFETYGYNLNILREISKKYLLIESNRVAVELTAFRAAYIKRFWLLLDLDNFVNLELGERQRKRIKLEPLYLNKRNKEEVDSLFQYLLKYVKKIDKYIPEEGYKLFNIIKIDEKFYVGEVIKTARKVIGRRNPKYRNYAPSATMDSYLSRALVNFSQIKAGEVFLDPFAGSGSIAIEAATVGSYVIALDKSSKHIIGFLVNLSAHDLYVDLLVGDATKLPIKDNVIDGIATDPPYGRSATTFKREMRSLYFGFIREASRVLRRGKKLVFCAPSFLKIENMLNDHGFSLDYKLSMRVHKGLVRDIYISTLH